MTIKMERENEREILVIDVVLSDLNNNNNNLSFRNAQLTEDCHKGVHGN